MLLGFLCLFICWWLIWSASGTFGAVSSVCPLYLTRGVAFLFNYSVEVVLNKNKTFSFDCWRFFLLPIFPRSRDCVPQHILYCLVASCPCQIKRLVFSCWENCYVLKLGFGWRRALHGWRLPLCHVCNQSAHFTLIPGRGVGPSVSR